MSTETLLEHSYLIKDARVEMERLDREEEEKLKRQQMMMQMDAFGIAK